MRPLFWGALILLALVRIFSVRTNFPEGKKVRITLTVRGQPTRYRYYQKINFRDLKIYLPLYPEISYGDKIVVEGTIKERKLEGATLIKFEESRGIITGLRERIIDFYNKSLPEPHASLIAGITLGAKSEIPEDFWNALTKTGVAHVVVASGSNVSLVAGFLVGILTLFFARGKATPLILVGIWLYAALAGLDAPIVRAAIMGSIAFSALKLGKLSSAWKALVFAALIMLIINPEWVKDIGFILSFVATASLMLFQARIEKFLRAIPGIFREGLSTSLAAQIGVAPILFMTFGQFNLLSPIANALVLWTVPPIMVISGVSGLFGLIFPGIARLILYLSYPLTSWFIFIIELFS